MKRLITILFACMCCSVFGAKAQTDVPNGGALLKDILRTVVDTPSTELDPTLVNYLDVIYSQLASSNPRFKMYKTTHDYISLKLDTATGKVWMVQIGMGDKASRMEIPVDDTSPLLDMSEAINGRYELYPTNNSYNFIMIDTHYGSTYQVQWHIENSKRFRKTINEVR